MEKLFVAVAKAGLPVGGSGLPLGGSGAPAAAATALAPGAAPDWPEPGAAVPPKAGLIGTHVQVDADSGPPLAEHTSADAAPAAADGALRPAAAGVPQPRLRGGDPRVDAWRAFAAAQVSRFAPPPPRGDRRVLPEPRAYRVRLATARGLPALHGGFGGGGRYRFEASLTLYNEAAGVFYGATCRSALETPRPDDGGPAAAPDTAPAGAADAAAGQPPLGLAANAGAAGSGTLAVDFDFDVFFLTRISDPRCIAVVELCLAEVDAAGLVLERASIGWAALPLFASGDGAGGRGGPGAALSAAAVTAGSPRYLLYRSLYGENLPPPLQLPGCTLLFRAEAWPAADGALRSLVPEDFPLCVRDAIPGLLSFDPATGGLIPPAGACGPRHGGVRGLSTLAAPAPAPRARVALLSPRFMVPQQLHSLIAALPALVDAASGLLAPPPPADLAALTAAAALPPTAALYWLRIGAHNGRAFVDGGPRLVGPLSPLPATGAVLLGPPPPPAGLAGRDGVRSPGKEAGRKSGGGPVVTGEDVIDIGALPLDARIVVMLQLLAAPADDALDGGGATGGGGAWLAALPAAMVAQTVFSPFQSARQHAGANAEPPGQAAAKPSRSPQPAINGRPQSIELEAPLPSAGAGGDRRGLQRACEAACAAAAPPSQPPPLLQWRALLGDVAARRVPAPKAAFKLAAFEAPSPEVEGKTGSAGTQPCSACAASKDAAAALAAVASTQSASAAVLPPPARSSPRSEAAAAAAASTTAVPAASPAVSPCSTLVRASLAAAANAREAAELAAPAANGASDGGHGTGRHLRWVDDDGVEGSGRLPAGGEEEPDGHGPRRRRSNGGGPAPPELAAVAGAMKAQIERLAEAVEGLREERDLMRSSLRLLGGRAAGVPEAPAPPEAAEAAGAPGIAPAGGGGGAPHTTAAPAGAPGAEASPAGGQQAASASARWAAAYAPAPHHAPEASPSPLQPPMHPQRTLARAEASGSGAADQSAEGLAASEVTLQLLALRPASHTAGARGRGSAAGDLLPPSVFFTAQFFDRPEAATPTTWLGEPESRGLSAGGSGDGGSPPARPLLVMDHLANSGGSGAGGAGVVLSWTVDGSLLLERLGDCPNSNSPPPTQRCAAGGAPRVGSQAAWACTAGLAAALVEDERAALAGYLGAARLAVDVWDAQSLLLIGTAHVPLSGLLRCGGRALAEVQLEVPLAPPAASGPDGAASLDADGGWGPRSAAAAGSDNSPGSLLLRLVNAGRRPAVAPAPLPKQGQGGARGAGGSPAAVRLRPVPREPGSPLARELAGRVGFGSPAGASHGRGAGAGSPRGPPSQRRLELQQQPGVLPSRFNSAEEEKGGSGGDVAADVMGFEQRKLAREAQLRGLLQQGTTAATAAATPWGERAAAGAGGGGGGQGAALELERQLLADVEAARARQRPAFIRSQLERALVTRRLARPSPGEALLLLHPFQNPTGRAALFAARVAPAAGPSVSDAAYGGGGGGGGGPAGAGLMLLRPVESDGELSALLEACPAASRCPAYGGCDGGAHRGSGGGGDAPPAKPFVAGGRVALAAGERASLPFVLRLPPEAAAEDEDGPCACDDGSRGGLATAGREGPAAAAAVMRPQLPRVEVFSEHLPACPLAILEVLVVPRRAAPRRSLRVHAGEGELLRASVSAQLPAAGCGPGACCPPATHSATSGGKLRGVCRGLTAACSDPSVAVVVDCGKGGGGCGVGSCKCGSSGGGASSGAPAGSCHVCGGSSGGGGDRVVLHLRRRVGPAPGASGFVVWLYSGADPLAARPLASARLCVHSHRRLAVGAEYGGEATAALPLPLPLPLQPSSPAGGSQASRAGDWASAGGGGGGGAGQIGWPGGGRPFGAPPGLPRTLCFSSAPEEMAPWWPADAGDPQLGAPTSSQLSLRFRPAAPGARQARLHVVEAPTSVGGAPAAGGGFGVGDSGCGRRPAGCRLLAALLIDGDARPPHVDRTIQIDLPPAEEASSSGPAAVVRSLQVANPYPQPRAFALSSDAPSGLLTLTPPGPVALAPRGACAVALAVDVRRAAELLAASGLAAAGPSSGPAVAGPAGAARLEAFVFVRDAGSGAVEECWRVAVAAPSRGAAGAASGVA